MSDNIFYVLIRKNKDGCYAAEDHLRSIKEAAHLAEEERPSISTIFAQVEAELVGFTERVLKVSYLEEGGSPAKVEDVTASVAEEMARQHSPEAHPEDRLWVHPMVYKWTDFAYRETNEEIADAKADWENDQAKEEVS